MSWPAYPEYRESGIQWLGEIPVHWNQRRGKYLFERMQRPAGSKDEIVTAFRDGEVTLRRHRREEGFTVALKESGYQGVRRGDLVIHAMDAFAGAIGVSAADGKCSPVYSCCRPHSGVSARLYAYLLRAMAGMGFIESLAKGIRERSTDFRWAGFGELRLPVPPTGEQQAITWFLDHETARIDALIEEQQRLIDLLQEKRQAVISHAVTKGLDPDVPMKNGGVEWLGEVPAHWKVIRVFHAGVQISTGKVDVNIESEDGPFPFFTCGKEVKRSNQFSFDCEALLVAGNGEVGYTQYYNGKFEAYQRVYVLSNFDRYDPAFIRYHFSSNLMAALEGKSVGSVIQFISLSDLRNFPVPSPDLSEQKKIVVFLNQETSRLDSLLQDAFKAIALLREHRSALISAAVAGKIDVRGWKPHNAPVEHELPRAAEPEAPYG